jgi:hypothetical protein
VKGYKFQALVTMYPAGNPRVTLGPSPRRMLLRAEDSGSRHCQFYSALVTSYDGPLRPGGSQLVATMRVIGDDVCEHLGVGGHFGLWLGEDVGQGVITRRLFV